MSMRPWLQPVAKLGALMITVALLTATSYVPDCPAPAVPVAFRASGGCGPGGLIVVGYDSQLWMENAVALGLPPLRWNQAVSGRYFGASCGFSPDSGEWGFVWNVATGALTDAGESADAAAGEAGAGGDASESGVGISWLRECVARPRTDGSFTFTCTDSSGAVLCESRLTKVVLP